MALAAHRFKPVVRLVLVVLVSYTAVEEEDLSVHIVVHMVGWALFVSSGPATPAPSHQQIQGIYK